MTHKHHIIPKHEWVKRFGSLKGVNAPDNLVFLSIEQHAQAHQLLHEINADPFDLIAYQTLSGQISKPEALELARLEKVKEYFSNPEKRRLFSNIMKSHTPWNKGLTGIGSYKRTPETIAKLKAARAKQRPPTLGVRHTPEVRERMRQAAIIREARKRMEL